VLSQVDSIGQAPRFVEAAGIETHVAQWGTGDDLLLIHGASSDMGVFEPTIVPLLKDRFRLTAYDRPGMGFTSQRPPGADQLGVQAKVGAGVIEALGLKKPIVVGHSWGGAVALRLALDHPDKVGGLLLIAPVAYEWPGAVSWHIYWSSNPVIGELFTRVIAPPFASGAVRAGLIGAFGPNPVPKNYFEKASSIRAIRPAAMRANSFDIIASKREIIGQQARYPEIKVPTAIMTGDKDTVVSPMIHSVRLARTLANARIDVLQDVGHLPHEASPERFMKLLEWVAAEGRR